MSLLLLLLATVALGGADGVRAGDVVIQVQQIPDAHPMVIYCWASVTDGGPTLKQHRLNVLVCLERLSLKIAFQAKHYNQNNSRS